MMDLHDVCDLIRERIKAIDDAADLCWAEGGDNDVCGGDDDERRQWERALDVVRAAAREEG